jgi:N-methylhydantoinase B
MPATLDIDPIALEIRWARLISVMDEVDAALVRTAFSTIVGETRDFAVVLLDRHGRSIAQSQLSSPAFTCSLPQATRTMLAALPSPIEAGDVLITNDPWICHGHLPDVFMAMPIFDGPEPIAFVAAAAHISDIGGRLDEFDARDVFEEGLRIPPSRLLQGGRRNEVLYRILEANVRYPRLVIGDLEAIIGAFRVGEARYREMLADDGAEALNATADAILALSQRAMSEAIAALPDGRYSSSIVVDGHRQATTISAIVTIEGSRLHVDYRGSSPERRDASVNCVMNVTYAHTVYPLKCALVPDLPNNEGLFGPISAAAPEGSILNARFPAPVKTRSKTSYHVHNAIFAALAEVIPERVQAGSGSFWSIKLFGSDEGGEPFAVHVLPNGGKGAIGVADGLPTIAFPGNGTITPAEVIENGSPVLLRERSLRPGSGGAGRQRGGLGQVIRFTNLSERPIRVTIRPDKLRYPAPGLLGGEPGALGEAELDGHPLPLEPFALARGQEVTLRLPGGGGFGPANERSLAAQQADLATGTFTPANSTSPRKGEPR